MDMNMTNKVGFADLNSWQDTVNLRVHMYETVYDNCTTFISKIDNNTDNAKTDSLRLMSAVLLFFSVIGLLWVALSIIRSPKL